MTDKRIRCLDIARGLAMILIIVGHSVDDGIIKNVIYSFHVPLFFFLSGYLFKVAPPREIIRRNGRRLLRPYLVTSTVLVVYGGMKAIAGKGGAILKNSLLATVFCCGQQIELGNCLIPSCGAIWFLPALFSALLFLSFSLKRRHPACLILLLAGASLISARYVWMPFGIQAGGFASLFVYAGYMERNEWHVLEKLEQRVWVQCAIVAAWLPCVCFGSCFLVVIVYAPVLPLNLVGAFCGIYLFLSFCKLLDRFETKASALFAKLGQNTLIVLCAHLLDIRILPWSKCAYLNGGHATTFGAFALIFAVRLTVAIAAIWARGHSKLLKKIF